MSQEDSAEDRQNFEFLALQAIYGDDIKDLRDGFVLDSWVPLNLSLTLTPQQGNSGITQSFVQVELHIHCNHDYPNSVPNIIVRNNGGLSIKTLLDLREKLNQKAFELVGQEMILQLSQYVREFLLQHNKPPLKSCYDEMHQRRKVEQERDLQAQQIEQERERQDMIEEVQRREEILKMEEKKRKEIRRRSSENAEDSGNNRTHSHDGLDKSEINLCNHKNMTVMTYGNRVIHRGQCRSHSSSGCVFYTGMDKDSGELVDVGEWIFETSNGNDLSSIQRQISSIDKESTYLLKLKHPNLSLYYGMKYDTVEEHIIVNHFGEFIHGSNCNSLFINRHSKPDFALLKHIAKEVLTALEYLHRNNVIHKDIDHRFVILSNTGTIKLSNYSIYKRLSDLYANDSGIYSKKTDIFEFGKLILSLVQGKSISEEMDVPKSIQSDLYDFLERCLAKDESTRYTASSLLNHSYFHKTIEHFPPKHEKIMDFELNTDPDTLQKAQMLAQSASGQSRLDNEFEFLQDIGKGAFGDVIKVRNKLDGGYYAIKRIQLNPKNKSLNKKNIREVKLLSRLNHENVVRYYNSWIETTIEELEFDKESSSGQTTYEKVLKVVKNNDFTLSDEIEMMSLIVEDDGTSMTYDSKSKSAFQSFSDEESSSDEDEHFTSLYHEEYASDDGIEFQHDSKSISDSTTSSVSAIQEDNSTDTEVVKKVDFMYIQMEFCEKSTLRTAIDTGLFDDRVRVWRLFREIVEGLAHIHQQGMIHRDLKPVNIFLDSQDHVKIGDFGLATTSMKSKQNELMLFGSMETEKEDTVDESKTGLVGTALYVAPEINTTTKFVYNQKVDIYSLGIILFEMCYRPFETSMERIKILSRLRMKETILPEDFVDKNNEKEVHLIRWLLDHDISKRPTSSELLQSEHVPPPVLEERQLREMVRHTLNNPQLKGYKYLVASCFTQSVTPAQNITYDKDPLQNVLKWQQLYDFVRQECIKIFELHGAQNLSTPLLMPRSDVYENTESSVKLMTHFGSIVCLPHDLRVPFARYVAWNDITFLRRYSIEKVYREKIVFGFHPRELYECAFDIVTPYSESLMPDAEIIYVVSEIINEIPALKNKRIVMKLNHVSLLESILLHFGIKDNHQKVYEKLSDIKQRKISKDPIRNYFISCGLSDSNINQLLNLLYSEFEFSKATSQFQMITKKKIGNAGHLARQALEDLKIICKNAESLGVEINRFDIVISPGLIYNIQQYSGMICQFVCEVKKKHKHHSMEVLAAGGRYDSMVAYYRKMIDQAIILKWSSKQSAVGISISLDKIVQVIQKEQHEDAARIDIPIVAVCSVGSTQLKEKTKILKCLRNFGIKCFHLESTSSDELEAEQLHEIKASHVIMLKDNEHGSVRFKSSKEDRFQLSNMNELLDNPKKILKIGDSYQDNVNVVSPFSRSDSKTNNFNFERSEQNQTATVDIVFTTSNKIAPYLRKQYNSTIRTKLEELLKKLSGYVTVIGVQVEANVIKTLAAHLEFDSEEEFDKSVETVIEKHQKYRKDLRNICNEIYEQKKKKYCPTVVLYNLSDYFYKVII